MKSRLFAIVLGICAAGTGSRPMCAATPVSSFGVTATVQATCMVLASGVMFGTGTGEMVKATSTVSVNCTHSTPYNVSLGTWPGSGGAAAAAARTPADSGAALLRYVLPSKSQSAVNHGRVADIDAVAGTGNGSTQTVVIHGNILAGRYFATGVNADTITVTVIY